MQEFKDSQKKIEEEKNASAYLKQIKKFSKISDAFLEGKSVDQLKLLADAVVGSEASNEKPTKPAFQNDSHRDGAEPIILADGTPLPKKVKWEAVFDSVNKEFELGGISFINPDEE